MIRKINNRFKSMLFIIFVNGIAASVYTTPRIRRYIYRVFGIRTNNAIIRSHCYFETKHVKIGNNSFINRACYFFAIGGVDIGENCWVAPEVMFVDTTHLVETTEKRAGKGIWKPVKIGNGCWIGVRATILPGVQIGNGCIIAAGAVVTKDCTQNGLYAGVPAVRVKELP